MKLLHFTAEWCGPCKMMKPMIDGIVRQHPEIEYVMIDIDRDTETAQQYSIMGVPTFIMMDGDEQKARITGAMMKQKFLDALGI